MSRPESVSINIPALPKGGGAIQSVGKGWGACRTDRRFQFPVGVADLDGARV